MSGLESHYSACDIEERILAGIRAAGLDPEKKLTPESIAGLDHFHTGGLKASRALLEIVPIRPTHRVLDIGSGLGGSARMLADQLGCHVDCLEMSRDYCVGGALLNRLTGLQPLVEFHHGSALDLPFEDTAFDIVWMQNVGMNIEDKHRLYSEISRVLKPGGMYAFQEMATGAGPCLDYPLPWASRPSDNFLTSSDNMSNLMSDCGLEVMIFEDTSDIHLGRTTANATPAAPGKLGLSIFVDNLGEKAANARRSLEEGRVRLVRGVFARREG